jgi:hypothetical protein
MVWVVPSGKVTGVLTLCVSRSLEERPSKSSSGIGSFSEVRRSGRVLASEKSMKLEEAPQSTKVLMLLGAKSVNFV